MGMLTAAYRRLVVRDPKRWVEEALAVLASHAKVPEAGLFVVSAGGPDLVASSGMDQSGLNRVRLAWTRGEGQLRAGHAYHTRTFVIFPVLSGTRVSLLYVGGEKQLSPDAAASAADELSPLFAEAIGAIGSDKRQEKHGGDFAVETYLETTPVESVLKRQFLILLERNEGNVARVARVLGVTRVTVYNRIDRLGIPRGYGRKGESA